MKTEPVGVYLHIPFCLRKCLYCDFCSFPGQTGETMAAYEAALAREMRGRAPMPKWTADTVFFGGGTPTLLGADALCRLLSFVGECFDLASGAEITVEANPATMDEKGLCALRRAGFNRLSMGVQSFSDRELSALGRVHTAADAERFYISARDAGFDNVNMDVMFGIPEQTPASFRETLEKVVRLSPEHVSAYGLMLEEGTPFYERRKTLPLPSEEEEDRCADLAAAVLAEAGYRHYEISNFAREGYESRHNLRYWHSLPYFGFGTAAFSFVGGVRFGNGRDLSAYLADPLHAETERVPVSDGDAAYEYVMLRFRLAEGVDPAEYAARFGEDFRKKYATVLDKYRASGHIIDTGDAIRLSERGFRVSNAILVEMLPE